MRFLAIGLCSWLAAASPALAQQAAGQSAEQAEKTELLNRAFASYGNVTGGWYLNQRCSQPVWNCSGSAACANRSLAGATGIQRMGHFGPGRN